MAGYLQRYALLAGIVILSTPALAEDGGWNRVERGQMTFRWRWRGNTLEGELRARARGWIAVGFNTTDRLAGTRFLMITRQGPEPRLEEHVAEPPTHRALLTKARLLRFTREHGHTVARFSWPNPAGVVTPGVLISTMLAFSDHPELEHHSRWREHFHLKL